MSLESRIFLGYRENSEIRMHLQQSKKWKEDNLYGVAEIIEIVTENQHYIGMYIPLLLTLHEILEKEVWIKNKLQNYCPKLNLDAHSSCLLSQLFIF